MSRAKGDAKELYHDVFPMEDFEQPASGVSILNVIVGLIQNVNGDSNQKVPLTI